MRLRDEGFKAHTSLFDVADARAVEQAVADIENNIGPIDVLFNNAAFNAAILLPNFRLMSGTILLQPTRPAYSSFCNAWQKWLRAKGQNCQYLFNAKRTGSGYHYALRGGKGAVKC